MLREYEGAYRRYVHHALVPRPNHRARLRGRQRSADQKTWKKCEGSDAHHIHHTL